MWWDLSHVFFSVAQFHRWSDMFLWPTLPTVFNLLMSLSFNFGQPCNLFSWPQSLFLASLCDLFIYEFIYFSVLPLWASLPFWTEQGIPHDTVTILVRVTAHRWVILEGKQEVTARLSVSARRDCTEPARVTTTLLQRCIIYLFLVWSHLWQSSVI